MPLVMQLHLVMMIKNFMFGVVTLNTFRVMVYIKVFDNDNDDNLAITIAQLFLRNRQAKSD